MAQATQENWNEGLWHLLFACGHPELIAKQKRFQKQGKAPRCKLCMAPFGEVPDSGWRDTQPGPSNRNPRYCSMCDVFIRANPGGAKVRMTLVFVDVRGSTALSEELALEEYVRLINDFYARTTQVFVDTDGFMMDVVGDEVFALYPSGFSGVAEADSDLSEDALVMARQKVAAQKAIEAAKRLIEVGAAAPPGALQFGTSVLTGDVYIGTIRGAEEGISDVRVWGREVNTAARLCSRAEAGEAVVSLEACRAAGLAIDGLERRSLELKGIAEPVEVCVLA